jgi:hypothetical protein
MAPPKVGSGPPPVVTPSPDSGQDSASPEASPPQGKSTIWKKLERFDKNNDGKLDFQETKDVFDSVGLPSYWSFASALATVIARGPIGRGTVTKDDLAHPHKLLEITLADVQQSLLKGQSGVFDRNANADPQKAQAFIDSVKRADGNVTLEGLNRAVEKSATESVEGMHEPMKTLERKKHFAEAYSAWVQLMEVAGHTDSNGTRYLTPEQMKSVFDGTMFDMIFAGRSQEEKVSVMRIVTELLGKTLKS